LKKFHEKEFSRFGWRVLEKTTEIFFQDAEGVYRSIHADCATMNQKHTRVLQLGARAEQVIEQVIAIT
jgi:hypothetical protein